MSIKRVYFIFIQLLKTTKPLSALSAYILSTIIVAQNLDISFLDAILRCIPILLITMTAFLVNDIYDYKKDIFTERAKPVAKGLLSKNIVWITLITFIAAIFSFEYLYGTIKSIIVVALILASIYLYNPVAHKLPLVKGLITALLCCTPLIYGCIISGVSISYTICSIIIIFCFGREVIGDLRDLEFDKKYGLNTIPKFLNKTSTIILGWSCMFGASLSLFLFAKNNLTISCSIFTLLLLFLGAYFYLHNKNQKWSFLVTRITMICGAITIAFML